MQGDIVILKLSAAESRQATGSISSPMSEMDSPDDPLLEEHKIWMLEEPDAVG